MSRLSKPLRITLFSLLGVFLVALGGFIFIGTNPAAAAQFTDTVLRPILGDQRVIALEGHYFDLRDRLNQKIYARKPIDTGSYAATTPPPSAPPTTQTATSTFATPSPTPVSSPIPLQVTSFSPLANEGMWQPAGEPGLERTFIRTDPTRSYSVVTLLKIDQNTLRIGAVAGTHFPGGPAGPGKVPAAIQQSGKLIAAFNGGFQEKDGHYGMVVGSTTYVPLRKGLGTVFIDANNHATIGTYTGTLDANLQAVRQNGPLIVSGGKISSQIGNDYLWAGTASGNFITWRSGLGQLPDGSLVYAVGPSLTPTALATAFQAAGVVNAIELDVNTFWVRCMLYTPTATGYTSTKLLQDLADGGTPYLNGYEKDFFYLYQQ